jgi:CHASE3 domain sensor protein
MFDLLPGLKSGLPLALSGDESIPLFAILVVFGIPIIAILTNHQRKMAEIIHRNQPQLMDPTTQNQLNHMQNQISEMRAMMQEHIINNDRTSTSSVEQRLNQ